MYYAFKREIEDPSYYTYIYYIASLLTPTLSPLYYYIIPRYNVERINYYIVINRGEYNIDMRTRVVDEAAITYLYIIFM